MAEQNFSSPTSPTPIVITTTTTDAVKSDLNQSNSISSSCDSRIFSEKSHSTVDETISSSQPELKGKTVFSSYPKTCAEIRNGVSDMCSKTKTDTLKACSLLRPSALGSSFNNDSSKNTDSKNPLKSPKLNLTPSKFGNTEGTSLTLIPAKLPSSQSKNLFMSSVCFDNDKNESFSASNSQNQTEKESKTTLGTFTNVSTPSTPVALQNTPNSTMSVPNFVFGQNLHERVVDNVKAANEGDSKTAEAATNNGTSDMLFTSAINSKEAVSKENQSNEVSSNSKESSSLLEDAARYQEARANKRKYEEVLVTTGEEGEENILQVNVKLFAFDNGTWVERGRGTLRLNDKNCDGIITSRIVIRTLGSLRVVLNTKIWGGMTLNRASERSIRITALDPNGQLKIFLIQTSPKDMATLYRSLEIRVKRCQEKEAENSESPEKKIALDDSDDNKT